LADPLHHFSSPDQLKSPGTRDDLALECTIYGLGFDTI
jgi:hypothetical protein